MKFSNDTLNILKNFAMINQSIMFKPGSELRTIANTKQIFAVAKIEEVLETRAAIWDLSRLLSVMSVMEHPEIVFGEKQLAINSGTSKVKYTYAAENLITIAPESNIEIEDVHASFHLKWEHIDRILKSVNILRTDTISITGDGNEIFLKTALKNNVSSDSFTIKIDQPTSNTFKIDIKPENLKLIPSNYNAQIDTRGFIFLESDNVKYWVTQELEQ